MTTSYPKQWVKLARQVHVHLGTGQVELAMSGAWMSRQGTLSKGNIDGASQMLKSLREAYRTPAWKKVSIQVENAVIKAIKSGRWHFRGLQFT